MTTELKKLPPKTWLARVVAYAALQRQQQAADAAARAAKCAADAAKAELLAIIGDAPGARCSATVLTVKHTAGAAATLTTTDGKVVPWAAVTSVLAGNTTIPAAEIAKLFGGRAGGVGLSVAGA